MKDASAPPPPPRLQSILNGRLVPADVVQLPAEDRGVRYGESVFTTIRVHRGKPFRLDRHVERMAHTLATPSFGFSHAVSAATLTRDIARLVQANGLYEGRARYMVTAGAGNPTLVTLAGNLRPSTLLELTPLPDFEPLRTNGARVHVTSVRRVRGCQFARHKLGSYMPNMVARREAVAAGHDEGILTDGEGALLEGAFTNLFLVRDGMLLTPHVERDGVLPGVQRELVLEVADGMQVLTSQEPLLPALVTGASEAFLTNSIAGILPIRQLGTRQFNPVPGSLTQVLMDACHAVLERECSGL